jgi:tagatose-1,6-bisphosphate aldolase non-catalytic subunit AgaZ/GatZ
MADPLDNRCSALSQDTPAPSVERLVAERDELVAALRSAREEIAYQIHKGHRIYSCARAASLPGLCDCGLDEFRVTQDRIDAALAKAGAGQ